MAVGQSICLKADLIVKFALIFWLFDVKFVLIASIKHQILVLITKRLCWN